MDEKHNDNFDAFRKLLVPIKAKITHSSKEIIKVIRGESKKQTRLAILLFGISIIVSVYASVYGIPGFSQWQIKRTSLTTEQIKTDAVVYPQEEPLPNVKIKPIGWKLIRTITGDYGIRAAFSIENFGSTPLYDLHIQDEYYFRIELSSEKVDKYLESLQNKKDDRAIFAYQEYREEILRDITDYIHSTYKEDLNSKIIQAYFNDKWKGNCFVEVYNQDKRFYFRPQIVQKGLMYETGRSVGRSSLEENVVKKGTEMIVICSVITYRLTPVKKNNFYNHFIISKSIFNPEMDLKTLEKSRYVKLELYEEWIDKKDNSPSK